MSDYKEIDELNRFLAELVDRECKVVYPDRTYKAYANSCIDGMVRITALHDDMSATGYSIAINPSLAKFKFDSSDEVEFYAC